MQTIIKRSIKTIAAKFGYTIHRVAQQTPRARSEEELSAVLPDVSQSVRRIIKESSAYSLTSPERLSESIQAVRYICRNKIRGSIVECGVWMGGSTLAMITALIEEGDLDRDIYLYDTFEGMTEPSNVDVAIDGETAESALSRQDRNDPKSVWCNAPLEQVTELLYSTPYPREKIHFVQGKVEDTISTQTAPDNIAILRLDTDWFESTHHELTYLYPKLVGHGVLIIDDYGHWLGAREAVDSYFAEKDFAPFLARTDYTGRIAIKPV